MHDKLIITAVSVISPVGDTFEAFMNNIANKVSAIKPVQFEQSSLKSCLAAGIPEFDPTKYLEIKGLRYMDRSTTLLLSAVANLVKNAFTPRDLEDGENTGVIIGNTFGSLSSISNYDRTTITKGYTYASPSLFPNCAKNSPASRVSIQYNIQGVNLTTSNGVAATLNALEYAVNFLHNRRIDLAIVGGVEELCAESVWGFAQASNAPESMILGEGAAVFILERPDRAQENKRKALAEIAGSGVHFAGKESLPQAIRKSVEKALHNSQLGLAEVDVIISHVGGTPEADYDWVPVLDELAGDIADPIPVISLKGNLGECYSASGAFQIAAAVGILQLQEIPPVVGGVELPTSHFTVPVVRSPKRVQNILLVSADYSGLCVSQIISKAEL